MRHSLCSAHKWQEHLETVVVIQAKRVVIRFALMTCLSDACLENGFEQDEIIGRDASQEQVGKATR